MFQGFTKEAVEFLWGIRLHNERSWFLPRKQEYLDLVDRPLRELGGQLQAAMAEEFPEYGLNLHVCRIYRDARRLHGRGPYKDHLWLTLRPARDSWTALPAFYFELAPEFFGYGMGCYDATPVTMAKLRARIRRDPKPLEKLAVDLEQSPFQLEGEPYKRPKGDPGPILFSWYNRKSIDFSHEENCEGVLFTPQLADQVMDGFRFLAPYYAYLFSLSGDPEPEQQ